MRRLFLKTFSSNEEYDANCSFAIVEITPALLALIEKRRGLMAAVDANDDSLAHLAWWDYSASFIEDGDAHDTLADVFGESRRDEILDGEHWIEPPNLAPHPFEPLHTELDQMFMNDKNVWWQSTPKHSSITLETAGMPLEKLLDLKKEL